MTGCPSNSGTRLMECVRMPVGSSRVNARAWRSVAHRWRLPVPTGGSIRAAPPRCHPGPQSEQQNSNLTAGVSSQSPATDRLSPPGWSNISLICRTAPASPGSGRSAGLRFLRSTSPCPQNIRKLYGDRGVCVCGEPARSVSRTVPDVACRLLAFSLSPQPTRREQKPTGEDKWRRPLTTAADAV